LDPLNPVIPSTTWTCYDPGTGLGQFSVANGYLNPLQDCLAICKDPSIVVVTPICPRTRSCPCGWDSVFNSDGSIDCNLEDITGGIIATIPAIEKCMMFPNQVSPQITNIWEHQSNPPGQPQFSWQAAVVVDIGGQITSITSLEQYTTC
jgi:hypothetical protein